MEIVYGGILVWMGWLFWQNHRGSIVRHVFSTAPADAMIGHYQQELLKIRMARDGHYDRCCRMYREIDLQITGGSLPIYTIDTPNIPSPPRLTFIEE